ncbi:caspase-6 [Meleagris gallopavo]|uniref:caspase-6 n=1 Tax=Meleagris gallopavo TaxID=9103 RepID=UPI0012AB3D94|nr:caspase-6 [Meleagris gallopavo]
MPLSPPSNGPDTWFRPILITNLQSLGGGDRPSPSTKQRGVGGWGTRRKHRFARGPGTKVREVRVTAGDKRAISAEAGGRARVRAETLPLRGACTAAIGVLTVKLIDDSEPAAKAPGRVQLDSKPTPTTTDGNQNITEVDAFDIRQTFDPAEQYKMNHQRRGVALIFNHEHFFWHLRLPDRRGTLADRNNLKRSLTDLGFEVRIFDDLKAEDVLQKVYEASLDDYSNADCFVCVFLSHGENDHVYAYDAQIKIETITNMFRGDKCQSLVGKPKIFIIQACRGDKHDDPVLVQDLVDSKDETTVNQTEVDAAGVYTLPAGADFIMCYSVAQGYFSHRETVNGSWYIQDLCEALRKHGSSLEFTELLTVVNRKVSHRKVDMCRDINAIGKKQIPCFASMLTKKLYFHPKSK